MTLMRGLWLEDQHVRYRNDLPVLTPPAGEALIRLRLAGICATDLELRRGYYPYTGVMGHEFVGDVMAVTSDCVEDMAWIGKRVVGEINAVCGKCEACRAGRSTHCEQRTVLGIINRDGVFADSFMLPVENLHVIPDHVPDEAAVFVEPLAAALEVQQQVAIHPTDRVLIVGAGRLGQLIAQTLAPSGCDLCVIARHPRQRELLAARNIAVLAENDLKAKRFDIVIEATGSPSGFTLARQAIRPRGTMVLKSTYAGDLQANFSSLVVDEITLVGSRCGPFAPALRMLEAQQVDPQPLIEGCYPLSQGEQALERAAQPGALKILLQPG